MKTEKQIKKGTPPQSDGHPKKSESDQPNKEEIGRGASADTVKAPVRRAKPPAPTREWLYFTAEALMISVGVDLFAPDMDLVGYAIMLQNALPIRIQHATDYDVQEASYDTIVMMRLQIKFRMQKVHADGISNAELEQTLQGELRRLSRNLAGLPAKEGVPLHTEVLRKVQAVSISKISRAANPDEDYAEMLNLGAKTRP